MRAGGAAAILLLLVGTGCVRDGEAEPSASTAPATTPSPTGAPTSAATPTTAPSSGTLSAQRGPTDVRFRLIGAERQGSAPVVAAYERFWVTSTQSIIAYALTDEFRTLVSRSIERDYAGKAVRDRGLGRTLRSRPVGRLESVSTKGSTARLVGCLWGPSVAYYDAATGKPAEKVDTRWFEVRATLQRENRGWIIDTIAATGAFCPGGAP